MLSVMALFIIVNACNNGVYVDAAPTRRGPDS